MSKEFESNLQNIANSIGKELNALFIPKLRILGVYDKDVKENYIEEFRRRGENKVNSYRMDQHCF